MICKNNNLFEYFNKNKDNYILCKKEKEFKCYDEFCYSDREKNYTILKINIVAYDHKFNNRNYYDFILSFKTYVNGYITDNITRSNPFYTIPRIQLKEYYEGISIPKNSENDDLLNKIFLDDKELSKMDENKTIQNIRTNYIIKLFNSQKN